MVNLRIVAKQMQRSSKKCEKNEKAALEKLKKVGPFVDFRHYAVKFCRVKHPSFVATLIGDSAGKFRRCSHLRTRCHPRKKPSPQPS